LGFYEHNNESLDSLRAEGLWTSWVITNF
jgi:hypothetical protein